MGFRETILERFALSARKPATNAIDPSRLRAFKRKELEMGITLYLHLKSVGHTFEDLIAYIDGVRAQEQTARVKSAVQSAYILTREERKHLKKAGSRRRNKNV